MLNFSEALECLKMGSLLARTGWNAEGQFAVWRRGYPDGIPINRETAEATRGVEGAVCVFRPYLLLCAADGSFVPWVPTVSDILADDWITV